MDVYLVVGEMQIIIIKTLIAMKPKNILIILEIVLIVIMLVSCLVIEYRSNNFKRDCKVEYNDNCPCTQTKFNQTLQTLPFNTSNK